MTAASEEGFSVCLEEEAVEEGEEKTWAPNWEEQQPPEAAKKEEEAEELG